MALNLDANYLPVDVYDTAEDRAKLDLSHIEIMAFAPRTFAQVGFPERVKAERELARHADWNHDPENQEYYRPGRFMRGCSVQTDFTRDEATTITWVRDQVAEMTRKRFGRAVRPMSTVFAQMGLFRIINALRRAHNLDRLSVFELGPAQGYLGAMLMKQGIQYASMDNAQGFYLYQNRLYTHIDPEGLTEWGSPDCLGYGQIGRVTHLPWWEYLRLHRNCPISADIVVSNANLGEMTRDAMRFAIRVSRRMLEKSELGLFIFASIGLPAQNAFGAVEAEFASVGFRKVFENLFYGYILDTRLPLANAACLELKIPLFNPSGRCRLLAGGEIGHLPDDERAMDLDMIQFIDGWTPPIPKAP